MAARDVPSFAHPVERALALVLDRHGTAWEYEPHTFVLVRNPDGSVREAFTPDFYLPELDLYVECTVLRQRLTNRKRRKARKARLRAGVKVEVLYRRDIDRLLESRGGDQWRGSRQHVPDDRADIGGPRADEPTRVAHPGVREHLLDHVREPPSLFLDQIAVLSCLFCVVDDARRQILRGGPDHRERRPKFV